MAINPILSQLNSTSPVNNMLRQIGSMKKIMTGKNPDAIFRNMMQNNPRFRDFVNQNQGKSAEQIAQENGIDIKLLGQLLK